MDHQGTPPGLLQTQILRLRRAVGQSPPGRSLKRFLGREVRIPDRVEPAPANLIPYVGDDGLAEAIRDPAILADALAWRERASPDREVSPNLPESSVSAPGGRATNIVIVSHCDFTGSSGLHVYAIACELHRRGLSPVIAVPENVESVDDVGRPPFPVLTYDEVIDDALRFPDGRSPDLLYAFSPRELVRHVTVELVRRHGCRYVVHLEDNDEVVLSGELGGVEVVTLRALPLPVLDRMIQPRQSHPLRGARFLERAAGITVLIDRLLELIPPGVPAVVIHAGFDEAVLEPVRPRAEVRSELGLGPGDFAIVYTGSVHSLNREEMSSLYGAVGELRRAGQPVVLVKTGWGSGVAATFPSLGAGIRDLGWVPRKSIPELLSAADVLVQPGGPNPFNDYRFPSKLPEYLASGRPVVMPRTNVGLELRDGEEAILLERGDAQEIAAVVTRLAADSSLRERLGQGGRAFALRKLRWSASVDSLQRLLAEIEREARPPVPAWVLDGADPPAKLIAFLPDVPTPPEAAQARSCGVHALCFDASTLRAHPQPTDVSYPFCVRLGTAVPQALQAALASFAHPAYLRIGGAPLVFVDADVAIDATLRGSLEVGDARPVYLAVVAGADEAAAAWGDAVVEAFWRGGEQGDAMRVRLSSSLPPYRCFRSLVAPSESADLPVYSTWLRKLALQGAVRDPEQPPFIVVDALAAWADPAQRAAWLEATRSGLREGVRQFYASQKLTVTADEAELILRSG